MLKSNIEKSLELHIKTNDDLYFYKECLDNLINYNQMIEFIGNDNMLIESCRIEIMTNPEKYNIYLSNSPPTISCSHRKIDLEKNAMDNLLKQLIALKEYGTISGLAQKLKIPDMDLIENDNMYTIYFIITSKPNEIMSKPNEIMSKPNEIMSKPNEIMSKPNEIMSKPNEIMSKDKNIIYDLPTTYEMLGYLLGVNCLEILKYQRLDRVANFINGSIVEAKRVYEQMDMFLKFLKTHTWQERDRMIVMSGAVYQAIGLTYTTDIDTLVVNSNKSPEDAKKVIAKFAEYSKKNSIELDPNVLANDKNWHSGDPSYDPTYKNIWLTRTLPRLSNCRDIYWLTANPECHMCCMGINYITLETNIVKNISRANGSTLSDLIMIKHLNNYDVKNLCVPNMTIRQGEIIIYDQNHMKNLQYAVKKMCKIYYGADIGMDEITQKIQRCNDKPHEVYSGNTDPDPDTQPISRFHMDIKHQIFKKYCNDVKNLLDIGSGKMVDLRIWKKFNIENIVGIEPSTHSIDNALKRVSELDEKINVEIVNGFGNENWSDPLYEPVMKYKYDMVTFQYTIHYMIDEIEQVIKNLLSCMNNCCTVVVTCMDGNLIERNFAELNRKLKQNPKMLRNRKLEHLQYLDVRNTHNDPIFIISKFDLPDQIMMYLKGSYGVTNGSIEKIVKIDKLIARFAEKNIRLVERKPFLHYHSEIKQQMTSWQKEVSAYYVSLIFKYNVEGCS